MKQTLICILLSFSLCHSQLVKAEERFKNCSEIQADVTASIEDGVDITEAPARSVCYYRQALYNTDPVSCEKALSIEHICYYAIALKKSDYRLCLKAKGENDKKSNVSYCLWRYANEKKDVKACRLLPEGKQDCVDSVSGKYKKLPLRKK